MIEGGGSASYSGVRVYILLAVRGIDGPAVRDIAERFKRTAKYTNVEIGGEIVDLDTDDRLMKSLSQSDEGRRLYSRVQESAPVICVSNSYIGDPETADKVELLRFADYERDTERIFELIEEKMKNQNLNII